MKTAVDQRPDKFREHYKYYLVQMLFADIESEASTKH